jgi:hypothetical protein
MAYWKEIVGDRGAWMRDLAITTAVGVFFALVGPFGSYERPLLERVVYCVGIGWACGPVFFPGVRLGLHLINRVGWPIWAVGPALSVALCVPIMAVGMAARPLLLPGVALTAPSLALVWHVAVVVIPLTLAALAIHQGFHRAAPEAAAAEAPAPAPPRPAFLDRVPARLGDQVLALEAEDHYVRVHTPLGSTLILMRFADAVEEMAGAEGLRVHRSWWVAKAAVRDGVSLGRRMNLVLEGGLAVPVSRDAAPRVRRANWI